MRMLARRPCSCKSKIEAPRLNSCDFAGTENRSLPRRTKISFVPTAIVQSVYRKLAPDDRRTKPVGIWAATNARVPVASYVWRKHSGNAESDHDALTHTSCDPDPSGPPCAAFGGTDAFTDAIFRINWRLA